MIRYNWKKILRQNNRSSNKIINTIYYLTFNPIIINTKSIYYKLSIENWVGYSFLHNPEALLKHRGLYNDVDIAEYIGLASLRSYSHYKTSGELTLDLLACDGKEDLINKNRLLYIDGNKVHFMYEEVQKQGELNHGISVQRSKGFGKKG